MTIELRTATPADVEGIRRVSDRAWHEAHAPIIGDETVEEYLDRYYDADSFRSLIDDEETVLDVAVDDGDVVGFVSVVAPDNGSATYHLSRIYVHPDRYGEGIGGRLLDRAESEVTRRGGTALTLGVMAENDRAVGFYESRGYHRIDETYDETIDAQSYVYEKDLP